MNCADYATCPADARQLYESFDYGKHDLDISFEQDSAIRDFYYGELYKILDNFPQMIPDVRYSTLIMFANVVDKLPLYQDDLFVVVYTCVYLTSKIEQWSLSISDFINEFNLLNIPDIQNKIITCEIKIINVLEFNLNFPNPINMLRAVMIIVEHVIKHTYLEDLTFICEKYINNAFKCRQIINKFKISDIVLSSFTTCQIQDQDKDQEDSGLLKKIIEIIAKVANEVEEIPERLERIRNLSESIDGYLRDSEESSINVKPGLDKILNYSQDHESLSIIQFWDEN